MLARAEADEALDELRAAQGGAQDRERRLEEDLLEAQSEAAAVRRKLDALEAVGAHRAAATAGASSAPAAESPASSPSSASATAAAAAGASGRGGGAAVPLESLLRLRAESRSLKADTSGLRALVRREETVRVCCATPRCLLIAIASRHATLTHFTLTPPPAL